MGKRRNKNKVDIEGGRKERKQHQRESDMDALTGSVL